ncbi:hypothetical protein SAMN04488524_3219 [Pedobacter africanus]|uniref:Uncharacterized protein n=2 Tax=Pedobacter africanus TaxID=151894 RepID=A0A1W2CVD9_9SPHI|nr:hypothetical protein SAMN04488524_3219 [Pedobacter africanus]
MVFVLLLVGTLTVFALSSDSYRKHAVFQECIKYNGPQNPVFPTDILEQNNWNSLIGNPFPYCFGGSKLCAICFENMNLTPADARWILYDYYIMNASFPMNGSPITDSNGNTIWVYTKSL